MAEIGEIIKQKRNAHGLSLKKLGSACSLSDTEISKIESGKRKSPSWISLCKIAEALDSHPFEFLLAAGYITENDIHPPIPIQGLNKLNDSDINYLQLLVDFIISRKHTNENSKGGLQQCDLD